MAKSKPAKGKSSPKSKSSPASDPSAAKVTSLVEATAAKFMAACPSPTAADVPGVTQGGKPAHAVGAPMAGAFGSLSPAMLKSLLGPLIKNGITLAVQFGGQTVEDIAASQADLLDDFIPDAAYEFIEKLAHRMHGGEPHAVGGTPPTPAA